MTSWGRGIAFLLLLAAYAPSRVIAQNVHSVPRTQKAPRRLALDIENLRAVPASTLPNDVPTCQVLVIGGGLGGVAAAEILANKGISVILTEPTSHLGGQLTAQGVSVPDENSYIERDPGPGTRNYRKLREQVRDIYSQIPGVVPSRTNNIGQCWVSRVSGLPSDWETAIRERLAPFTQVRAAYFGKHSILQILLRNQLLDIHRYSGNGKVSYADFQDLDTGRILRIGAQYILDASETGDALFMAGSPTIIGQEAQATYNEPDAPTEAHPEWVQSMTYCFDVRWTPEGTHPIIAKPTEYDTFQAWGEYSLTYHYSDARGLVTYQVFSRAPQAAGPFWTYRRLLAASSFTDNPQYDQDISLINWPGNDFREESPLGKPILEQLRIFKRAKAFARGFLYWLQTECPRDDGGNGYPEMQPAIDTAGPDGFAIHPYIRESRRLLSEFTLNENDLIANATQPDTKFGTEFFDTVGTALYAIDIHPARDEPPHLRACLPYHLPLGAFIPRSGPSNIIPAAKNFGASRLALASARMHPTEWESGEIAGHLAAFCLNNSVVPTQVRNTPDLLKRFQDELELDGITIHWSTVLPPKKPGSEQPSE